MTQNFTDPIWWILVDKEQKGPFSYLDLERKTPITPDTYVWREGMEDWQKARDVEELQALFKDYKDPNETEFPDQEDEPLPSDEELTIDTGKQPPNYIIWILIILLIILYVWYLSS